jgi:hypothetical protein
MQSVINNKSGGTFNAPLRAFGVHRIYATKKRRDCNAAVLSQDS